MVLKPQSRWDWISLGWFVVAIGTVVFDRLSLWTMCALILSMIADAAATILHALSESPSGSGSDGRLTGARGYSAGRE